MQAPSTPKGFVSAALHLVIHCLSGPLERKALAVGNVARVLAPDGVLFGASVLGKTESHNPMARAMLHAYNRRGAFDNLEDSKAAIGEMLARSFEHVEVDVIGSITVFAAWRPRVIASD